MQMQMQIMTQADISRLVVHCIFQAMIQDCGGQAALDSRFGPGAEHAVRILPRSGARIAVLGAGASATR